MILNYTFPEMRSEHLQRREGIAPRKFLHLERPIVGACIRARL